MTAEMTHRERALAALAHREPDRVPIDFGGTSDSTINAVAYADLRRHLGLSPGTTRVVDVCQHTAVVEEDVRRELDIDVAPVFDWPRRWRDGQLPDGSAARFPAGFRPTACEDGSQVVFDDDGNVALRMPRIGHYFDPVFAPLAAASSTTDIDRHAADIDAYDKPSRLDVTYEQLASVARHLHEETDYLLVGYVAGHLLQAGQVLRGWESFLIDLVDNPRFAEALLDRLTESHLTRFAHYAETVAPHVQVVHFEEDLGAQDRPLLSPELYRRLIKPYQAKLFAFAKQHFDAYLLLHSDGAIAPLIPDFIEMGVDALNPVQVSAAGMDAARLKSEYGRDITLWGAGCDPHGLLQTGTPAQVADEVRRRIDELAVGGGYIFSGVHNVQPGVPPENTEAMFRAAALRFA